MTRLCCAAAGAGAAAESDEESTDDESDLESASSSDPSMPDQGEFDDGTEWGKYTTVYEEKFDVRAGSRASVSRARTLSVLPWFCLMAGL